MRFAQLALVTCLFHNVASDTCVWHEIQQNIYEIAKTYIKQEEGYPVIHGFVDSKVNNEWSALILEAYSRVVPIVIFQNGHKINQFSTSNRIKLHNVIGIFESVKDINVQKWKDLTGDKWDPRAKFIIWITGGHIFLDTEKKKHCNFGTSVANREILNPLPKSHSVSQSAESLRKLLEDFWSVDAAYVLIIAFNKTLNNFDLLTFNPFVLQDDHSRGKVYYLKKFEKFFPEKFINLHGYPMTITMFEDPIFVHLSNDKTKMLTGEDVLFFQTLQAKMNFTPAIRTDSLLPEEISIKSFDKNYDNLIESILYNRSEILGNSIYVYEVLNLTSEFLYPTVISKYVAIVPRHPQISSFHIISKNLLAFGTLAFLIPFPILTLYLYLRRERYVLLETLHLIVHRQFSRIESKNYDRIIKLSWIAFAMVVLCSFESRLIEVFTSSRFVSEINTIEDLSTSNLTLIIGPKMSDSISLSPTEAKQKLAKKTKIGFSFRQCIKRLINYGDVACACDKKSGLYTLSESWHIKGKYNLHLMREELTTIWITYAVKKHFPYRTRFKRVQRRLLESGIYARTSRNSSSFIKKLLERKQKETIIIKTKHLKSIFYICVCGFGFSILVFIGEIYNTR
ncbi:hypothetical protein TKK_0013241 [Trichogramma kaykai]